MKDYFLKLLETCAPGNGFAQDAIEHALVAGNIPLTGDFAKDTAAVMENYDAIITSYRKAQAGNTALLLHHYQTSGFLLELQTPAHAA